MVFNFCNLQCFFVILLLLLQAGDIETNPGPENLNIERVLEHSKNLIIVGDLNEDQLNPNFHNIKGCITYQLHVKCY